MGKTVIRVDNEMYQYHSKSYVQFNLICFQLFSVYYKYSKYSPKVNLRVRSTGVNELALKEARATELLTSSDFPFQFLHLKGRILWN